MIECFEEKSLLTNSFKTFGKIVLLLRERWGRTGTADARTAFAHTLRHWAIERTTGILSRHRARTSIDVRTTPIPRSRLETRVIRVHVVIRKAAKMIVTLELVVALRGTLVHRRFDIGTAVDIAARALTTSLTMARRVYI